MGHQVCQTWPCSKHTMLIWDMVGFGIICLKPNHDPNVSMLIWNMVGFGVSSVPNLTMFQIWFGISQVGFGCWSHFGHGYSQIENYDLGCPKSKFRFGDVPNQIRNKVAFGLQQTYNKFYFKKFYLKKSMFKAKRKSKEFREVSVSIPKIICLKKVQVY